MLQFDLKTIIFVAFGITFVLGLLLAYLKKIAPHIKGPFYWAVGSLLVSSGILIFGLYPITSDYLAFVIAGTIALLGLSFYLAGIWRFKEINVKYWLILIFPLLEFIQGTVFYQIIPNQAIRMTLYSLLNVVLAGIIVGELLKPAEQTLKIINRIGATVFLFFAITMLIRSYTTFFNTPAIASENTRMNIIWFLSSSFLQILMVFVFIIMVNIKLANDLRNQIKTRNKFFSIISHDLNGPIGTISTILKELNSDVEMDEIRQRLYLDELNNLSASTYHLLQNLLKWSVNQLDNIKVQKEIFDLNILIKDNISLLQELANQKSIKIDNKVDNNINCVGDKMMIDSALRNVISNSIKFTKPGGSVSVNSYLKDEELFIKVKDTGIGMSQEKLQSLFHFDEQGISRGTEGEKGSGIGLILCKEFIEKNAGKLLISSQQNIGTEVIICLPVE